MDTVSINNLLNNIVKITYKKTNEELVYNNLEFRKVSHKYSNTKEYLIRIFIDNKCISRNNPYRVSYKCIECGTMNIVNLNNLVRKMNNNITKCNMCKNLCVDKCDKQREFMKSTYKNFGKVKSQKTELKKLTVEELIENSKNEFDEMDDDYCESYFNKHLTNEEFERYRSKIISFQNDKFTDINKFDYCSIIKIKNQTYFNPYFFDKDRKVLEKPIYIKFKCECCDSEFTHRNLFKIKNKIKLLCNDCSLTNRTFKIRSYKNLDGDKIHYQSKYELKFIKYCNKNNINIVDGPRINYIWKDKNRKYVVDFYIPKLNILVELKDNHIWHKNNLENGKWNSKLEAVNKLVNQKIYKEFLCIYPKNYVSICKYIKCKI